MRDKCNPVQNVISGICVSIGQLSAAFYVMEAHARGGFVVISNSCLKFLPIVSTLQYKFVVRQPLTRTGSCRRLRAKTGFSTAKPCRRKGCTPGNDRSCFSAH